MIADYTIEAFIEGFVAGACTGALLAVVVLYSVDRMKLRKQRRSIARRLKGIQPYRSGDSDPGMTKWWRA